MNDTPGQLSLKMSIEFLPSVLFFTFRIPIWCERRQWCIDDYILQLRFRQDFIVINTSIFSIYDDPYKVVLKSDFFHDVIKQPSLIIIVTNLYYSDQSLISIFMTNFDWIVPTSWRSERRACRLELRTPKHNEFCFK